MSQSRFIEYQAPVNSFPLSEGRVGIVPPGRYRGYDSMVVGTLSNIPIKIQHTTSGILNTGSNNQKVANQRGTLVTPHGTVLMSDDDIEFSVAENATGNDRYDIIYCEYSWVDLQGGSPATFTLLAGSPGAGIPSLPNDAIQVLIGIVTVPAGSTLFSDLSYEPVKVPLLGDVNIITNFPELDNRYARLAADNTFTETNRFEKLFSGNSKVINGYTISNNQLVLDRGANSFFIKDVNPVSQVLQGFIPAVGESFPIGTELIVKFEINTSVISLKLDFSGSQHCFIHPQSSIGGELQITGGEYYRFLYVGNIDVPSLYAWVITDLSWSNYEQMLALNQFNITSWEPAPVGGNWRSGDYTAGGYTQGNLKILRGNIIPPASHTFSLVTDYALCTLPSQLRPTRPVRVSAINYSNVKVNTIETVFPRVLLIGTSGLVTLLAGPAVDDLDLYFNGDATDEGLFLDGISYI